MKKTKMKVLLDEGAVMPVRAHADDAGLDLFSREDITIPPGGAGVFDTGVHIALPADTVGLLMSKSGLNVVCGLTSEGVIDEGYTGSIVVKLDNHSKVTHRIKVGQKVSQLLVVPIYRPELEIATSLVPTERRNNGFGSTGK